jgi:hypothetical protein
LPFYVLFLFITFFFLTYGAFAPNSHDDTVSALGYCVVYGESRCSENRPR